MLDIGNGINDGFYLFGAHYGWKLGAMGRVEYGRELVRFVKHMLKEKGKGLGCHLRFYTAATQRFYQVNHVIYGHLTCNQRWPGVSIVFK
jgi:hypothetical protein